jgi:hypothetical protein
MGGAERSPGFAGAPRLAGRLEGHAATKAAGSSTSRLELRPFAALCISEALDEREVSFGRGAAEGVTPSRSV